MRSSCHGIPGCRVLGSRDAGSHGCKLWEAWHPVIQDVGTQHHGIVQLQHRAAKDPGYRICHDGTRLIMGSRDAACEGPEIHTPVDLENLALWDVGCWDMTPSGPNILAGHVTMEFLVPEIPGSWHTGRLLQSKDRGSQHHQSSHNHFRQLSLMTAPHDSTTRDHPPTQATVPDRRRRGPLQTAVADGCRRRPSQTNVADDRPRWPSPTAVTGDCPRQTTVPYRQSSQTTVPNDRPRRPFLTTVPDDSSRRSVADRRPSQTTFPHRRPSQTTIPGRRPTIPHDSPR